MTEAMAAPSENKLEKGSWLGLIFSPKFLCLLLLISLAATLTLQSLNDPSQYFSSGMKAVNAKDTAAVADVILKLGDYPQYAKHRDFFKAFLAVQNNELERGMQLAISSKEHPDVSHEAAVLAGEAAYKLGAPGNAKLLWEEVLLEDPKFVPAHQWLGALYYDIGAMNDAIYHLEQVSELRPTDPRPDRLMGLMNRDYERPEVAIPHYLKSLERDPNQSEADAVRLELAECHVKLREFEQALEVLKQCDPSPKRDLLSVRCHLNLGMLDEVRSLATSLIDVSGPEKTDALQLNAEIALADGKPEAAAEFLKSAIQADPFSHGVRTQYAQVLGRLGRTDASREQSQVAADLQSRWQKFSDLQIDAINVPTNAEIRCEIGFLARELGKPELAIVWYKAALGIDPSNRVAAQAIAELTQKPATSASTP